MIWWWPEYRVETSSHINKWQLTLVNHELCTVSQDFLLYWYIDLRFCLCALCKNSWIVFKFLSWYIMYVFIDCIFWTDHISLCKLDLSYLCIIITNYYYYMYFIVETRSVLCLLLSIDKFYIHFGGSLEYLIIIINNK